ncbi:hypothetical protein B566_EDAN017270 [Ephemera danica]|nr:hypothetical protein B566_EDAN017270 [Ephemera danica]
MEASHGTEGMAQQQQQAAGSGAQFPLNQQSSGQNHNPLICFMCNDYYEEPCLMSCFHSFCARCLQGRESEGKIQCPLCGQHTALKEGNNLPPSDMLLRQLIELFNAENPPCANCDKRNRAAMFFCHTCGQALCAGCRDNTHRAKMFSTHEIIHMSKCAKEQRRRTVSCKCATHGELFIMFSNTQKNMLCINCFRDTPAEARLHCVDIDTAYTQSCKKLERAVMSVCELQGSVREGMVLFRTLLEELKKNMDLEKNTINSFCQGMQEAIARTHASMIMEVQRQFETKERLFRNQLVNLASILPILQMHLLMCTTFSTSASKYEFLDLAYPMMERLAAVIQLGPSVKPVQGSQIKTNFRAEFSHSLEPWVGMSKLRPQEPPTPAERLYDAQPPASTPIPTTTPSQSAASYFHPPTSRRQQTALRAKALEGEGPFSNHCRSFDAQVKELSQQLAMLKEQLQNLHREVVAQRPNQPASTSQAPQRLEMIARDCSSLEETLERHQVELERLKNVFDSIWEEQLCRIHVEKDIFQTQGATPDSAAVSGLTTSLSTLTSLEPHLQSLLDRINLLQMEQDARHVIQIESQRECRMHSSQVTSPIEENVMVFKEGKDGSAPIPRARRGDKGRGDGDHQAGRDDGPQRKGDDGRGSSMGPGSEKRGVIGQLINKVRTKDDRGKKSPGSSQPQEEQQHPPLRAKKPQEREKSISRVLRGKTCSYTSVAGKDTSGKMSTFYQSISGKVMGGPQDQDRSEATRRLLSESHPDMTMLAGESSVGCVDVERIESQLKEKLHDMGRSVGRIMRTKEPTSSGTGSVEDGDYQRIPATEVRAVVHRDACSTPAASPRRATPPGWAIKKQSSCESLSLSSVSVNSRRSSNTELTEPPRSASAGSKGHQAVSRGDSVERRIHKQHSWETFPPKRGGAGTVALAMAAAAAALAAERAERMERAERAVSAASTDSHRYCQDPNEFQGAFDIKPGVLKKADSFEGHEEAVRTLVAAVQETRTLQRKPKPGTSN